jgi:hypothetical protein
VTYHGEKVDPAEAGRLLYPQIAVFPCWYNLFVETMARHVKEPLSASSLMQAMAPLTYENLVLPHDNLLYYPLTSSNGENASQFRVRPG